MYRHSSSRRWPIALAAGVALTFAFGAVLVTSVISAAPASAHAALVRVTPSAGAALSTAPTQVVLEFDEPVSNSFAAVVVTTSSGVNVAHGKPMIQGAKVTQPLGPDLGSGAYRIAYRVVSDDGHPVSGESQFTLTLASQPGPSTSTSAASPSPATPSAAVDTAVPPQDPTAGQEEGLTRFLLPVAGAVVLLVIGAGVLSWERQRR
jgi:methionine-rich copper-binding protein CopC